MALRKICVLTGGRSEYGYLRPVMEEIKDDQGLELQVIATGTHISGIHGKTVSEIIADGFSVFKTGPIFDDNDDSSMNMALATGRATIEVAKLLNQIKPDIIVLLGDRDDILGGTIAASYLNIPIAHIHGGDVSQGGMHDDSVRHAITKLAHIHFPASDQSAERIEKMGEEKWRIHQVGSPSMDAIYKVKNQFNHDELKKKYNLEDENYAIFVYHPITTDVEKSADDAVHILDALKEMNIRTLAVYPNADAGGKKIIKIIERYSDVFSIYKNIPRDDFIGLMCMGKVMIGNSSAGLIEAPACEIATVNVGDRQKGRERVANVIDSVPEKEKIKEALQNALAPEFQSKLSTLQSPYGDGKTSKRMAKILKDISIDKRLLQKQITY